MIGAQIPDDVRQAAEELRARQRQGHDPAESAYGTLCRQHFDARVATWAEVDACADCRRAQLESWERTQLQDTIDPTRPYGQHIPLTCRNHPELRWSTKNIDYIGARSIFGTVDCDCPASDLVVANEPAR